MDKAFKTLRDKGVIETVSESTPGSCVGVVPQDMVCLLPLRLLVTRRVTVGEVRGIMVKILFYIAGVLQQCH